MGSNANTSSQFVPYLTKNLKTTGMETRKIFSCRRVQANLFKELFTPTWNKIADSVQYVSSTSAALDWTVSCDVCKQTETMRNEETRRKWRCFPKWSIDKQTQSHAFSVHALISQLYILQCINKMNPFTSYLAAMHQNTANLGLQIDEKNQWTVLMAPHGQWCSGG